MMLHKGSEITERHIIAADILRGQIDIAVIGRGGRSMIALGTSFGPITGPPGSAVARVFAEVQAKRALHRLTASGRALITAVVLFNRSIKAWAEEQGRDRKVETGKLIAALDVLADHYDDEIAAALARGVGAA
jgi:hypothetical protein